MTLNRMTLNRMTLNRMTLNRMTLSQNKNSAEHHSKGQECDERLSAKCRLAQGHGAFSVRLTICALDILPFIPSPQRASLVCRSLN